MRMRSDPVCAQADQKTLGLQKGAPVVVEKGSVRLDRVVDDLSAPVLFLQLHDAAEIIEPEQRRLAALTGEGDLRRVLRGDIPGDVSLQDIIPHFKFSLEGKSFSFSR